MSHLNKYGFGIEADGEPTTVNAEPPATNIPAAKLDETGPTDTSTPVTPMPEGTPATPTELPAEPPMPVDPNAPAPVATETPVDDKTIKIEIQIASEGIDKCLDVVTGLEAIATELRRSLRDGGLPLSGRNLANLAFNNILKGADIDAKETVSISNESFNSINKYEGTVASLEGVGTWLKDMWEKIKAFFAKIWNWIKGLFSSNKTKTENVIKETELQVAVVEAMETGNVPNEFKEVIEVTPNPKAGSGEPNFFAKLKSAASKILFGSEGNPYTTSHESIKDKYGFGIEDNSKMLSNISAFGFRYMGNPNNIVNDAVRFHMKMKGVEKPNTNELFSILDEFINLTKEIRSKKEIPSSVKVGIKNNIIDSYIEMTDHLKTHLNAVHDKSPNIHYAGDQFLYFTSNIPEFKNFGMDIVISTSDQESLDLAKKEYIDDVDGFRNLVIGPLSLIRVKSKEHSAVEDKAAAGPSWNTIKTLCAFEKNYINYLKSDKDLEILISKTDTLNNELELLINELINIAESNVEFSKDAKVFINMAKIVIKYIKQTVDVNYLINHNFLCYLNSYAKKSLQQWTMWPASNPVYADAHKASMGAMKHIRDYQTFKS